MLAWHFVGDTLRDGSPIPIDGVTLMHGGKVRICNSGLHASESLLDALMYAPGETVCRVLCHDIVEGHTDKFVCRERTILWRLKDSDALARFARWCALSVAHIWNAPDVVIEYLTTGDWRLREDSRLEVLNKQRVIGDDIFKMSMEESTIYSATRAALLASTYDIPREVMAREAYGKSLSSFCDYEMGRTEPNYSDTPLARMAFGSYIVADARRSEAFSARQPECKDMLTNMVLEQHAKEREEMNE